MNEEKKGAIEALLFMWGDPIEDKLIAKSVDLSIKEANQILGEMIEEYNLRESGIEILKLENAYQFATRKQ